MSSNSERQNNFFDICDQCKTNCCRNAKPPITPRRKKIIERHLKNQKFSIGNPFVQTAYTFPKEDAERYCIFFDKRTRKCIVHPVKPETCVAGPVTFDINVPNRKIELYLKKEDICPLAGMLYKNEEMLQNHLKLAKKEILRLISELDSEALKAILKIEEPQTFKIKEDNIRKGILYKLTSNL